MPPRFRAPSFEDLCAEQETVQAEKFQGRLLAEYNYYLFPEDIGRKPKPNAVADLVQPFCQDETPSLEGVLAGMAGALDRPVHWADMGGGRALPMRELASKPLGRQALRMTNVDLFDYDLTGLKPDEMQSLETVSAGLTHPAAKPRLIQANMETVTLEQSADVITSVEGVQYLNDPLGALCNWYNQLTDDGLLCITAGHPWSNWIDYHSASAYDKASPITSLLEQLKLANIPYATSYSLRFEPAGDQFNNLVMQKVGGTSLAVVAGIDNVWTNPWSYKRVTYDQSVNYGSLVQVTSLDSALAAS